MELEAIYETPLALAAGVDFAMPRTETLDRALKFIDTANRARPDAASA
ncbi:hypothetical protein [Pseudomonas oligotrophica]|nr:hypothetical protein [Pseudomonas oligotrophica]MCF7202306.1 hypothetical protein [Pseudomonas oligotrophica]